MGELKPEIPFGTPGGWVNEMENAAHLVGMGQPRVNGRNRKNWTSLGPKCCLQLTHKLWVGFILGHKKWLLHLLFVGWVGGGNRYWSLSLSVQVASYGTALRDPHTAHCSPAAKVRNSLTIGYFRNWTWRHLKSFSWKSDFKREKNKLAPAKCIFIVLRLFLFGRPKNDFLKMIM